MKETEEIRIFTDGSSRGNPGPGGWGVIMLYPRGNGDMRVDEYGGNDPHTTNNKMELTAAIESLIRFDEFYDRFDDKQFIIFTDSRYVINGITKWVFGWQKNNWQTAQKQPVLNVELWQKLMSAIKDKNVEWRYVAGHAETPANNRCDEIATTFADGTPTDLYKGPLGSYEIDLFAVASESQESREGKVKKSSSKNKIVYSYVSMVNGKIETHQSWVDTEQRVKGQSGARFKKSFSEADEKSIIDDWQKK